MNMLLKDIRYALRQLCRSPGFTLTVVITLALGIGALTTVATWTNAVLFSPWPHVEAPRQLRFVSATVLGGQGYSLHYDQYGYVRDQGRSWQDSAAFAWAKVNLTAPDAPPQAIPVGMVSASYFSFLGLRPQAGHFFNPHADDRAFGVNDEVVLSDRLWRMQFAANPGIIGRTIEINRHIFTVVGVAPQEFSGIFGGMEENAWLPLSSLGDLSAEAGPDPLKHYGLQVAVRMRPGVSDASVAAELHTLAHSFALQQHDSSYNGWDLNLDDSAHFERGMFAMVGQMLPVLLVASVLLMILVCMNIASLLAQNAARRQREIAIRTALGASPRRIAAQIFLETGLLAMLGGVCGWVMSALMSRALYLLLASFGPTLAFNLRADLSIVLFVAGVVLAVTLVCGMLPVRQSMRSSQREALHRGSTAVTGVSGRRLGRRILPRAATGHMFCGLGVLRTAYAQRPEHAASRSRLQPRQLPHRRGRLCAFRLQGRAGAGVSRRSYRTPPRNARSHWSDVHLPPAHGRQRRGQYAGVRRFRLRARQERRYGSRDGLRGPRLFPHHGHRAQPRTRLQHR